VCGIAAAAGRCRKERWQVIAHAAFRLAILDNEKQNRDLTDNTIDVDKSLLNR